MIGPGASDRWRRCRKSRNSNATPGSSNRGVVMLTRTMPYFMEFSPAIGMHAGYLPGYPHPMASFGCPEIWLPDSLSEFKLVLR